MLIFKIWDFNVVNIWVMTLPIRAWRGNCWKNCFMKLFICMKSICQYAEIEAGELNSISMVFLMQVKFTADGHSLTLPASGVGCLRNDTKFSFPILFIRPPWGPSRVAACYALVRYLEACRWFWPAASVLFEFRAACTNPAKRAELMHYRRALYMPANETEYNLTARQTIPSDLLM
jgi:hypothetical protein